MAVAAENVALFTRTGAGAISFALDAGTNLNRLLLVTTAHYDTSADITGLRYNGVPLIKLSDESGGPFELHFWYLQNPAAGSHSITADATTGSGNYLICARAFSGVDQTTSFGVKQTAQVSSIEPPSVSVTVASTSRDLVVDDLIADTVPSITPAAGQTSQANQVVSNLRHGASRKTAGASTTTMGWSWPTGTNAFYVVVVIKGVLLVKNLDAIRLTLVPAIAGIIQTTLVKALSAVRFFFSFPVGGLSTGLLRHHRYTITDYTKDGRLISVEASRTGDGPTFELQVIDLDIRFRGRRRWRDIN